MVFVVTEPRILVLHTVTANGVSISRLVFLFFVFWPRFLAVRGNEMSHEGTVEGFGRCLDESGKPPKSCRPNTGNIVTFWPISCCTLTQGPAGLALTFFGTLFAIK